MVVDPPPNFLLSLNFEVGSYCPLKGDTCCIKNPAQRKQQALRISTSFCTFKFHIDPFPLKRRRTNKLHVKRDATLKTQHDD